MYTVTYFMPVPRQKCSGTNYCHAVLCHCHKCEHNLTVSGNVGSAQIAWKNFAFFWWLQCHIIWFEWGWEMTKAGNLASWRFYGGDVCLLYYTDCYLSYFIHVIILLHLLVGWVWRLWWRRIGAFFKKKKNHWWGIIIYSRVGVINNWTMQCW